MASDSNETKGRANTRNGQAKPGIARLNVQSEGPMPQALQLVPEDIARKYNVLPQSLDGNTLRVYMANPSDILTIENLSIYTKKRIEPIPATEDDIKEAIDYNYKTLKDGGKGGERTSADQASVDVTMADEASDTPIAAPARQAAGGRCQGTCLRHSYRAGQDKATRSLQDRRYFT